MYRGTTPTLTFNVNFDVSTLNLILITFKQGSKIVLEKTYGFMDDIDDDGLADDLDNNDITLDTESNYILCKLHQEETLAFLPDKDVTIQLRFGFNDGNRGATKPLIMYVYDILHDGVI